MFFGFGLSHGFMNMRGLISVLEISWKCLDVYHSQDLLFQNDAFTKKKLIEFVYGGPQPPTSGFA